MPRLLQVEYRRFGIVQRVEVALADRRGGHSRAFERYALELCRHVTIQDLAAHLGVSWDAIKAVHKGYLRKRFARPRLKDLTSGAVVFRFALPAW